ncbi:MAG TPA: hypothetical protein VIY48_06975 [Candidatus Paceibacterota bacterium]
MPTPPKGWTPPPELLEALKKGSFLLPTQMKLPTLRREVGFMYRLPRFYGAAYTEWERPVVIAYPVPLNLIVRAMRWLWWKLVSYKPARWEEELANTYQRGYEEGRRRSFNGYEIRRMDS